MESEKSGFVNEMSEIWRKMQVKPLTFEAIWSKNSKKHKPRVRERKRERERERVKEKE